MTVEPLTSAYRSPRPDILYHYTDAVGLLGIARGKEMWGTHFRFMNDHREGQIGFKVAADLLETEFLDDPKYERAGIEGLINYCRTTENQANVFVISFTARGDLLSQWRAYGRNGLSYSMGFKSGDIDQMASLQGWYSAACLYYEDEQQEVMRDSLLYSLTPQSLSEHPNVKVSQQYIRAANERLFRLAPRYKHLAFAEERERRLISPITGAGPDSPIRFRTGPRGIVPYLPFKLITENENFVTQLEVPKTYIGPGGTQVAINAVWMTYLGHGVKYGQPELSEAPYVG